MLSDYGTFIAIMAYFGEPDSNVLDFISENYQESYTPAALTQFRRRNKIHKNNRAEYISIRYGLEIVERFNDGETVNQIAESMQIHPKYASAAIKAQGESTERRCTQDFLLTEHRYDLLGFIGRGMSSRAAAKWLEENRQISCSKNVVLAAMKVLTNGRPYLTKILQDIAWIFDLQEADKQQALKDFAEVIVNSG